MRKAFDWNEWTYRYKLEVSGQLHAPPTLEPMVPIGYEADLNDMKWKFFTLPGLELPPLGHPARR
jgi:hypothetical protein